MKPLGRATVLITVLIVALLGFTPAAQAATTISRAELNGTQVRIEGSGVLPNAHLVVNGGVLTGTADSSGNFKIENSNFSAPADCQVTVSDGSTSATATLSGCTVTQPPSSSPALSSVRVNPSDVVGGNPATGTVTLSAAAPPGGFVVDLTSDTTTAATVPPSVTVPAGTTQVDFPVTTYPVPNRQSATIIGTVGGDFSTAKYAIITAWDEFSFSHGSISVMPGGNGGGQVTSQPAGIDCTIGNGTGTGSCFAYFTVGTVVRLDARPASGSSFLGFFSPGCTDPSNIIITRGTNITCQVSFQLN